MGERWLILAGALVSVLLLYAVFNPGGSPGPPPSRPTSVDAGPAGQLAAQRWLAGAGVPVASLRERYTRLTSAQSPYATTGNLLVMVMPQYTGMSSAEIRSLWDWVAAGNTVLVLAAFNDTPAWSYAGDGEDMPDDLAELTGVRFTTKPVVNAPRNALLPLPEPEEHAVAVAGDHWLMAGVTGLAAESALPTADWVMDNEVDYGTPYQLAFDPDDGRGVAWLVADGDGQYIISAYGSLLGNAIVGRAGNRRLLANVVAGYLGESGTVIFDDFHQGLSLVYNARAFVSDPRFRRSLLLLGLAWLAWVLFAGTGLPPPPRAAGVSPARPFVPLVGDFLAERLAPTAAGERLFADLWRDLAFRIGRPAATPVMLDRLAATNRVAETLLAGLRSTATRLAAGGRVDLVALHNDLNEVRRQLR